MDSVLQKIWTRSIRALGSLKLTVALLGTAIFIIFAGTLALVDKGMWTVVHQYFRCWIAWVDLKIFFRDVGGGFPFPGGWLLGAALVVNLLVAHAARIRLQARGKRLALGLAALSVGAALTWLVISHVFDADFSGTKLSPTWRVSLQLFEGAAAAVVLFFGCRLLFARKAGIVLLHGGIVLLMLSELLTGLTAQEARMLIYEGQTVRFAEDDRSAELAIVDASRPDVDDVVVVPEGMLRGRDLIRHPDLPFDVRPLSGTFMKNAGLRRVGPNEPTTATAGTGRQWRAVEQPEESGASSDSGADMPALYVAFLDKQTGRPIGTYLVSVRLAMSGIAQRVSVEGREYDVVLRFKRLYKPYEIYLYDAHTEYYVGTQKPKDFSSHVRLADRERALERDVRIWMNNPLRYRGETLYQSGIDEKNDEYTILQVVENASWMIPYVSCMIVAVGLLGQFSLHLLEFLRKRRSA